MSEKQSNRVEQIWKIRFTPTFLTALFVVVINAAFNGQYGFHRDELDILMNARQPAWG